MNRRLAALGVLLCFGCPEEEKIVGGPCDDDTDCPAPLTCASDVCIDVTDAMETWQESLTDGTAGDASSTGVSGGASTGEETASSSSTTGEGASEG